MSRFYSDQRGITMTEMMIVVVTIGIFAAMAVPRFMEYIPKIRAKSAVKQVVSELRRARSSAISGKRPVGVYFDVNSRDYIVFVDSVDVDAQTYAEGSEPELRRNELAVGVEMGYITLANNVVIFAPDGSASCTGRMAFLAEEAQVLYEVSVLAGTGKVKMVEIESSAN